MYSYIVHCTLIVWFINGAPESQDEDDFFRHESAEGRENKEILRRQVTSCQL